MAPETSQLTPTHQRIKKCHDYENRKRNKRKQIATQSTPAFDCEVSDLGCISSFWAVCLGWQLLDVVLRTSVGKMRTRGSYPLYSRLCDNDYFLCLHVMAFRLVIKLFDTLNISKQLYKSTSYYKNIISINQTSVVASQ